MTAVRSLVFNAAYLAWTALVCILATPAFLLPRSVLVRITRIWARGIVVLLGAIAGLRHETAGLEHLMPKGAIYAFKHQSAWDTILLPLLLEDPIVVVKEELFAIPLFGTYMRRTGQLSVDRTGRAAALRKLLRAAERGAATGRPIVIFPEGTRMAPGAHRPYHPGVAALYGHLNRPVVPVALNSGLFWGRRRFLKKPGLMTVEFLPAIEPGLSRKAFLAELERRIESACERLLEKGRAESRSGR